MGPSLALSRRIPRSPALLIAVVVTAYVFGLASAPWLGLLSCSDSHGSRRDSITVARPAQQSNKRELPLANWSSSDLVRFRTRCGEPLSSEKVRAFLLDNLFNGVSPFKGFPPQYVKPLLKQKWIRGWGSSTPVFERLIREVKPRIVVELGSFLGASTTHMGILAKQFGLQTLILSVDDFRGWPGFRDSFNDIKIVNGNVMLLYQFMQNVAAMNLTDSIIPLPFSTAAVMNKLCEWGVYADLVEVDAAHDFHSAWADINAAYAIVRPGGVMFGHDYFTKADNRGVGRAVDMFARIKGLRVEPDGQHWILRSM